VVLTRRQVLHAVAGTASAIALGGLREPKAEQLAGTATTPGAWSHDPASPIGPPRWEQLGYPTCGQGTGQSPVNIRTRAVAPAGHAPLRLRYTTSELAVENTGHVVEVPIPAGVHDTLQIGRDRYELVQFHVHAPSEHAIDDVRADVEVHFVHVNDQGALAVVGVLFRIGHRPNDVLDRILHSAPSEAGEEVAVGAANPAALFAGIKGIRTGHRRAVKVGQFYAYDGSLTTPACTEHVRWSVLAHGGQVSREAVAHLHAVISHLPGYSGYPNNNRPLQPLNGRVITGPHAGGSRAG
jgi:carbonic anhydrase